MAAGDIRAGGAYVELFMRGNVSKSLDDLQKKLAAFGQNITAIGKKLAGIGIGITAPLLVAAQRFAAMGDQINKASQRTGVGVEALTGLKYAAEQSGASFEDLESGLRKMQKTIFEAADGSKGAQTALTSLGLTVKDLQGLSPDDQFKLIADKLNDVHDSGAKAAIGMEIMGKGAATLIPLMADGAAGINALQKRAELLGLTFSGKDAEAATKFGDICDDLWKQVQAVAFQIGAAVSQALMPFAEATTHVLTTVINWAKENRSLIIAVLGVGVGLLAAGAAVIAFGTAITVAGVAIGGIVSAFGLIGSAIALLANPIVLIGAGLMGLATYFLVATKAGGQALSWLGDRFSLLQSTAKEAFGGIADALGAGDISLAAQILWVGLQTLWIQGTQELQNAWTSFKAGFVKIAASAFYGAEELWENAKYAIMTSLTNVSAFFKTVWQDVTSFLGDLWDGFVGVFSDAWNTAINEVAKGLNYIRSLWDKSFDPAAAAKVGDEMVASQKDARTKLDQANAARRESERKTNVDQIERNRQSSVDGILTTANKNVNDINSREAAVKAAADANAKSDIDALEKRKIDLQKQLDDLKGKAAGEKKKTDDSGPPVIDKSTLPDLDDILAKRNAVADPAKAQGTFNAAGLQALQGGASTVAERTAKAAEETAKNTKQQLKQTAKFK